MRSFRAACLRFVGGAATTLATLMLCGLPAASQEDAKPKVIFRLIYIDENSPDSWTGMSRHPDYADALKELNKLTSTGILDRDIVPIDPNTNKEVPWPAGVTKQHQSKTTPGEFPREVATRQKIRVRVYKDGVEQVDKKYETDQEYDKAKDYFERWNKVPGWKAHWTAPGWPRPELAIPKMNRVDILPYNPPAIGGSNQNERDKYDRDFAAYKHALDEWERDYAAGLGKMQALDREGNAFNALPRSLQTQA